MNDWTRAGGTSDDLLAAIVNAETLREPERPLIEFRSPLQLKNYKPPPGLVLAGDFHIVKGGVFVIGGAPGVGKIARICRARCSRSNGERLVRTESASQIQGAYCPDRERRI